MKYAIAAANRRITRTTGQPHQQTTFPCWAVSEAKAWLDIILIGFESVVDTFLDFARSAHVLVACAKIEGEFRAYLPVVLAVEVRFIDPVLKKEWAVSFGEGTDTAVEKGLVRRSEGSTTAGSA